MVKSDLSGSSLTLLARLEKKWQSFGRSQHREHRGRQTIPETDTHLPSNEGDAEGPGSREVWVFKGGGVLCKGVVMDDGRLLIMEGLTEEPLLTSQKHVTGWLQVFSLLSFSHSTSILMGNQWNAVSFLCCFYIDGEILRESFNGPWCVAEGRNIHINQLNSFSGIYWKNLRILNGVKFASEYNNYHHDWPWVGAGLLLCMFCYFESSRKWLEGICFSPHHCSQFQIYLKPPGNTWRWDAVKHQWDNEVAHHWSAIDPPLGAIIRIIRLNHIIVPGIETIMGKLFLTCLRMIFQLCC